MRLALTIQNGDMRVELKLRNVSLRLLVVNPLHDFISAVAEDLKVERTQVVLVKLLVDDLTQGDPVETKILVLGALHLF